MAGIRLSGTIYAKRLMPRRRKKSAPASQPEQNPKSLSFRSNFLNNTFQRENPMSEIKSLVTAEAVKDVLRSEEVRSALKQQLRQNLEARLDAEVDAILDELLGGPAAPEPEDGAGDSAVSDGVVSQPDGSSEPQPGGEMMM
ncbi:hypothetical protein SS17_1441 [Escherichia coli O157:H7 str. SS17]|nr:hypothetical protein G2583_1946 [Escherichia coli O55:H7 str. CB9615]AIF93024.1 hypothetical protein SS17_1441 [Escherichia coli O157:H7 str. SS17]